ncbi:hypothetical protein PGQ11_001808 [Apiospora arundinis]|uniref:Uncharacterized protein n=1 Tax=Apiospora arundinis TaxID=335852 RepID=A0ABR2JHL1_9PEZI
MRLQDLENNSCYVDQTKPGPYRTIDAPNHVRRFSIALLDNDQTFLQQFNPKTDEDYLKVEKHESWRPENQMEVGDNRETKAWACEVQYEAQRLERERVAESTWQDRFFGPYFFIALQEKFKLTESESRASSRLKFYHEYFRAHNNDDWRLFATKGYRHAERVKLTMPKPDWAFYFPVHDTDRYNRTIPSKDQRWSWSSRAQDNAIENFSYRVLADLARCGMIYNARVDTRRRQVPAKSLQEKDLCCFPWLVVEHKKAREGEKKVLCQAANASMAAVMVMEAVARYAEDQEDNKHVLPIASITTVGKHVSAWITYLAKSEDGGNEYQMKLVWTGDMTALVDILQLRIILDNLHEWAVRQMKPLLSTYIDQWKFRHLNHGARDDMSEDGDINKLLMERIERAVRRGIDDRMLSLRIQDDDETMGKADLVELIDNLLGKAKTEHGPDDSESVSDDGADSTQILTRKVECLFQHYQTTRDTTERTGRASLLAEMKSLVGSLTDGHNEATKALLAETIRLREVNDSLKLKLQELDERMTSSQELGSAGVDRLEERLDERFAALKDSMERLHPCGHAPYSKAAFPNIPLEDLQSVAATEPRSTAGTVGTFQRISSDIHLYSWIARGCIIRSYWQEMDHHSGELSTSNDTGPIDHQRQFIVDTLTDRVKSLVAFNIREDGILHVAFRNTLVTKYADGDRNQSFDVIGIWQQRADNPTKIDVLDAANHNNIFPWNDIRVPNFGKGKTAGGKREDTKHDGETAVESESHTRSIFNSGTETLGTPSTGLFGNIKFKSFGEIKWGERVGKQEFDGGQD